MPLQEPTLADAAAFSAAKGCHWVTPEQLLAAPASRAKVAAFAAAGPNPMAHHARRITAGGLAGAAQVFDRLAAPEAAKHKAGDWLRAAREARLLGCRGAARAYCLTWAAWWRKEAMRRADAA